MIIRIILIFVYLLSTLALADKPETPISVLAIVRADGTEIFIDLYEGDRLAISDYASNDALVFPTRGKTHLLTDPLVVPPARWVCGPDPNGPLYQRKPGQ